MVLAPISSRNVNRSGMLLLTAHTIAATRNAIFEACINGVRPYSSLKGADMRGPIARPTTNMDTDKLVYIEDRAPRSRIACGAPGANIVEDIALH